MKRYIVQSTPRMNMYQDHELIIGSSDHQRKFEDFDTIKLITGYRRLAATSKETILG